MKKSYQRELLFVVREEGRILRAFRREVNRWLRRRPRVVEEWLYTQSWWRRLESSLSSLVVDRMQAVFDRGLRFGRTEFADQEPVALPEGMLEWYQRTVEGALRLYGQRARDRISEIIRTGAEEGRTAQEMARLVEGVEATLRTWEAERIVRTESMRMWNIGHLAALEASGETVAYSYQVVLDGRTSSYCRPLAGKTVLAEQLRHVPPLHPHCRTVLQPVFSWEEIPMTIDPGKVATANGFGALPSEVMREIRGVRSSQRQPLSRGASIRKEMLNKTSEINASYKAESEWLDREQDWLMAELERIVRTRDSESLPGYDARKADWKERNARYEAKRKQLQNDLWPLFAYSDGGKIEAESSSPLTSGVKKGVEFVGTLLGRSSLDGEWVKIRYRRGRAGYADGTRLLSIQKSDGAWVAVHELGHWIEDVSPGARRAAAEFLQARTHSEPVQRLRKLQPGWGYGSDEIAKPDAFITPYIGRIYPYGQTEVISMGVQYLYEDPLKFALRDPEHFEFVLNVLWRLHDDS